MIKRFLALLTALVLLPVSLSLSEEETKTITGPVAKTTEELDAMLDSAESVTTMVEGLSYENVTDEDAAVEAMGSVMEDLGCDDTTRLVLDTVRSTEELTVYTFRQQAGDLAVYGGAAKLIVDRNGTAVAAVATIYWGRRTGSEYDPALHERSAQISAAFLYLGSVLCSQRENPGGGKRLRRRAHQLLPAESDLLAPS